MTVYVVGFLILHLGGVQPDTLRVQLVGNAGVLLSDGSTTLLVDLPYESGAFGYQRYDLRSVEATGDVVSVITHHHDDHFRVGLFEDRVGWRVVGPPSVTRQVDDERVVDGDSVTVGQFVIVAVPSPHTPDHRSYRIQWQDRVLYFVGDTESTAELRTQSGIDLLFITPWLSCTVVQEGPGALWRTNVSRAIAYHLQERGGDRVCGPVETLEQGTVVTLD